MKNIDVEVQGHHKVLYDKEVVGLVVESIEDMTQAKFYNKEAQE